MNSFKQFLLHEAIALSVFRKMYKQVNLFMVAKYAKIWKAHKEDNQLNTSKRLYFPLKKGDSLGRTSSQLEIEKFLTAAKYHVEDYLFNVCYKVLPNGDLDVKNKLKIGKVLGKLGQHELVKAYQTDLNNMTKQHGKGDDQKATSKAEVRSQSEKPMMVVLCRHLVDYLAQTEGRAWFTKSCKGITNGYTTNEKYLPEEFTNGWLVAYLADVNDTKLENPIARVLIIPFLKKGTEKSAHPKSRLFVAHEEVYGTNAPGFTDRVEEIVGEIGLNTNNEFGDYTITDRGYTGTYTKNKSLTPSPAQVLEAFNKKFGKENVYKEDWGYEILTPKDSDWVSAFLYKCFESRSSIWRSFYEGTSSNSSIAKKLNEYSELETYCTHHNLNMPSNPEDTIVTFLEEFDTDLRTNVESYAYNKCGYRGASLSLEKNTARLTLKVHNSNGQTNQNEVSSVLDDATTNYFNYTDLDLSTYQRTGNLFSPRIPFLDTNPAAKMLEWFTKTLGVVANPSVGTGTFSINEDLLDEDGDIAVAILDEEDKKTFIKAFGSYNYRTDAVEGGSTPLWAFPEADKERKNITISQDLDWINNNGYKILTLKDVVSEIRQPSTSSPDLSGYFKEDNAFEVQTKEETTFLLNQMEKSKLIKNWASGTKLTSYIPSRGEGGTVIYIRKDAMDSSVLILTTGSVANINRGDVAQYYKVSELMKSPSVSTSNLEEAIQPNRYFFIANRAEYDKFLYAAENLGYVWDIYIDIPLSQRENGFQNNYPVMMIESDIDVNGVKVLIIAYRTTDSMPQLVSVIDREWGTDNTKVFISEYM